MLGQLCLLSHREKSPAFTIAIGDEDVEMVRGNFKIADTLKSVYSPYIVQNCEAQRVTLLNKAGSGEDDGQSIILQLEQQDGYFTLNIKASNPEINRIVMSLNALENEHIYGGGEQMSYLNLRGRNFPIWTSEPGVGRDKSTELTKIMDADGMAGGDYWTSNYPQPTFISDRHYACHIDGTAYAEMDFTSRDSHKITYWNNELNIKLFMGENQLSIVGQLAQYFGRQPALPNWAIGGAIIGLKDGDNSFARLEKFADAGTAISGLWCEDWVGIRQTDFGRRLFWNWSWNEARYPDLPNRIKELAEKNIRFLGYVNPYIAVDAAQFAEAKSGGHLALNLHDDEPYLVDFGQFDCGVVDFTRPETQKWFAEEIIAKQMIDFGLSGWMADFGEYLPIDLRLHDGSDPMEAHNLWPLLWAKVNDMAVKSRGRDDIVFFMRAGASGVQAHCPLLWAGDQCVDFSRHDGIGTVITAALSAGLVGNAYSHHDVGGYTSLHGNIRTADLMKRWAELGAFTPVMRSHEGNRPDDNLQYDSNDDLLSHFAAMSRVHLALAPYVRFMSDQAVKDGLPLQRPLFLHYPDDSEVGDMQDQYLYGTDMLVAPIIEADQFSRKLYLPAGENWVHLWSGKKFTSGWHDVASPYGEPPVFYKENSTFSQLFAGLCSARNSENQGEKYG
ncbi:alpha-glucosidase [Sphingorhabdus lutea]